MSIDYSTLEALRQNHPAWRLLASPHAPLMASFFKKVFVDKNARVLPQADLVEALEDELFQLREMLGDDKFPKSALDYLNDWAAPEKGWLRKFYRQGSDEVQFDLTPATEKAIAWLEGLSQRSFVGTESRLLTLFELLRQLSEGSNEDPELRLKELRQRRADIDTEIGQVLEGNLTLLDDTALKDRFMQFNQQARELLSDFREVEHNFRQLDRSVRERIAQWDGNKGELLESIMGERDAIADSDQGSSFQAFWDFLMSPQRQEEFSARLDKVLDLPIMAELKPDRRTRRIHYDWLEAGEHTQRTVAQLSQQLRRFLDDQAWLENRRIMDILHGIESKTLEHRQQLFSEAAFTGIDGAGAGIELPMERPLYNPPIKAVLADIELLAGDEQLDSSVLYSQVVVDKTAIAGHIRQSLQDKSQVSLNELCQQRPLQQGLAELVAYLELGGAEQRGRRFTIVVDDAIEDTISWQAEAEDGVTVMRRARLPRVIYLRERH
jgi:flagellar motility protein MotE (MotC chaperone)